MAVLFQISKANKSYGSQVLLDQTDATITDQAKIGFVGRNGAGKSTLLRVLLGEEELDSGEVIRHPNLRLGYLRQHDPFEPNESALEFLMRDSGQPDWKCGEVAGQFEVKGAYLDGPVAKLSGGWQTRLKLAALLLHEPNLLMLDEPTNFLDLRTQILLEHFLVGYRAAALIVSHDRAFLSATCDHTLDLSRGKLTTFPGKIEAFLEFQAEMKLRDERSNAAMMAKRRDLEEFIARNKARASTAALAQSKQKALDKLVLTEVAGSEPVARIRPPRVDRRKGFAVRCKDLKIGYPEREIATDVQVEIEHGSRAAIVGDNGQGKTTFLRTLVGSLDPLGGEVKWGFGCKVGVYAQHVYSSLPPTQTVLEYLRRTAAFGKKEQEILEVAGSMLFRRAAVEKPVSVLSGGERARLCMAGLLLSDHNILVLDEPGNHLDVDTVDSLVEALVDYQGTVIFTSHDRHFTNRVATNIVEVREGRVVNTSGNYDAYVNRMNQEIEAGERESAAAKTKLAPEVLKPGRAVAKPRRSDKEVRKELKTVEKQVATLDEQKRALDAKLMNCSNAVEAMRLHTESATVGQQLAAAEERWLELSNEAGDF